MYRLTRYLLKLQAIFYVPRVFYFIDLQGGCTEQFKVF